MEGEARLKPRRGVVDQHNKLVERSEATSNKLVTNRNTTTFLKRSEATMKKCCCAYRIVSNRGGRSPPIVCDNSVRTTDNSVFTGGEAPCTSFACVTNTGEARATTSQEKRKNWCGMGEAHVVTSKQHCWVRSGERSSPVEHNNVVRSSHY